MFVKAVARNRGVDIGGVVKGFGQGRMVTARDAVKLGMADRVATLEGVLKGDRAPRRGATAQAQAAADDDLDFRRRRHTQRARGLA